MHADEVKRSQSSRRASQTPADALALSTARTCTSLLLTAFDRNAIPRSEPRKWPGLSPALTIAAQKINLSWIFLLFLWRSRLRRGPRRGRWPCCGCRPRARLRFGSRSTFFRRARVLRRRRRSRCWSWPARLRRTFVRLRLRTRRISLRSVFLRGGFSRWVGLGSSLRPRFARGTGAFRLWRALPWSSLVSLWFGGWRARTIFIRTGGICMRSRVRLVPCPIRAFWFRIIPRRWTVRWAICWTIRWIVRRLGSSGRGFLPGPVCRRLISRATVFRRMASRRGRSPSFLRRHLRRLIRRSRSFGRDHALSAELRRLGRGCYGRTPMIVRRK